MAPISAILHRYGIRILRYLDDWLILNESRTTCIHAGDRLLHLCEELGLQVNHKKSSLFPSQDMTYLGMKILSVRFIEEPTETRIGNLLRIIEEFSLVPKPPSIFISTSWAIQQRQGVDLSLPVPDLSLCSYASDVGWGGGVMGGTNKCQESGLHAKSDCPSTSGR